MSVFGESLQIEDESARVATGCCVWYWSSKRPRRQSYLWTLFGLGFVCSRGSVLTAKEEHCLGQALVTEVPRR